MKKYCVYLLLLASSYCYSQIGINTESPRTLFHIDARKSASTTNPSTGTLSVLQQSDDVVVTTDGKVGIGTVYPASKLEINTQGTSGIYPIRIQDGTEGTGKFLVSDANGVASWKNITPPDGSVYPIQSIPAMTFSAGVETLATGSTFTVPSDGYYSMEVRWWAGYTVANATPKRTITIFQLRKNGVIQDQFQYNTPRYNRAITSFVILYTDAKANDVLSLWIYPLEAPGSMITNVSNGWTTAKVLFKKTQFN